MQFKLTEEQSAEVLLHLGNFEEISGIVNDMAFDYLELMYTQYLERTNHFIRYSKTKFFKKIFDYGDYLVLQNLGGEKTIFSSSSFLVFNRDFIKKNDIDFPRNVEKLIKLACVYAYFNHSGNLRYECNELYELLKTYSSMPFTLGTKEIKLFESVKENNEENIEILSQVGHTYDLYGTNTQTN